MRENSNVFRQISKIEYICVSGLIMSLKWLSISRWKLKRQIEYKVAASQNQMEWTRQHVPLYNFKKRKVGEK
jgi:hypothetical protein